MRTKKIHPSIFYLIPIAVNIIAFPFWLSGEVGDSLVPLFSLVFNTIIAPIFLAAYNMNVSSLDPGIKAICSFLSISISVVIHYCSWGFSTGRLNSPDGLTVYLMFWEFIFAFGIVLFAFLVQALAKHIPETTRKRPFGKADKIEGGILKINSIEIDLNALAQKYDCPNITKTKSDMLLHIREATGIELERAKWIVYDYFNSSAADDREATEKSL